MQRARRSIPATLVALAAWLPAPVASAQPAVGDLNGDGVADASDESLLMGFFGARAADPTSSYDAAADLNSDGVVDVLDLALFGAAFGTTGDIDVTPPDLFVTLNDVPEDMNFPLVVPPDGFQITLHFDSAGGSAIDVNSLSVTNSQDVGAIAAGSELAPLFTVTPTRAVGTVPAGSDLARASHYLTAAIDDLAANPASDDSFGFAVRDFPFGAPMENLQTVYLDFDGNRGPGSFTEDLREYGLSSDATPEAQVLEPQMRAMVIGEIVKRVGPFYGLELDGTPGPDAVTVTFTDVDPGSPRARICVGGDSNIGGSLLGASFLDVHNTLEDSDDCGGSSGIFPQAIDNLWSADLDYQAAIHPVDPGEGGVPVGEDPDDAIVLDPGFDPGTATAAQLARLTVIQDAVDAFSQVLATVIAHETGHSFGLVAHGAVPAGLYGGSAGGTTDHNVTTAGGTPVENLLMNRGGSFTFGDMTGRGGFALPVLRPLNWAYLHDRVVLDEDVTGLFDAPEIDDVEFPPGSGTFVPAIESPPGSGQFGVAPFPDPFTPVDVAIHGSNFLAPDAPLVTLSIEGDPTPNEVFNIQVVDPGLPTERIQARLSPFVLGLEGFYDVNVRGSDGQTLTVIDALEVRFQ
jgi:hypothetical protein